MRSCFCLPFLLNEVPTFSKITKNVHKSGDIIIIIFVNCKQYREPLFRLHQCSVSFIQQFFYLSETMKRGTGVNAPYCETNQHPQHLLREIETVRKHAYLDIWSKLQDRQSVGFVPNLYFFTSADEDRVIKIPITATNGSCGIGHFLKCHKSVLSELSGRLWI